MVGNGGCLALGGSSTWRGGGLQCNRSRIHREDALRPGCKEIALQIAAQTQSGQAKVPANAMYVH